MIDYDKIITELGEEISACNYRYNGMVPIYYQQELRAAITALIECRDSFQGLKKPSESNAPHDPYKVDQLMKMLAHETSREEEHYGARLHHAAGDTKILTIDAGGIRALITHYATHDTDLEDNMRQPIYRINSIPQLAVKEKGYASYPEDFPHLAPGEDSKAWKYADDWEIETTLNGEALEERLKKFKQEVEANGE